MPPIGGRRWQSRLVKIVTDPEQPRRPRSGRQRLLATRIRWCSRHSLQTQPRTYAGVVPCLRSSRRVAIRATSSGRRPFLIILGETQDLIGRQTEISDHCPELLTGIDAVQCHASKREPLLRPGFPESRWLLACARRYRRQRQPPVAMWPPRGSPQNGSGPLSLLKLSTRLMRLRSNKPGTLLAPACSLTYPALTCDHAESVVMKPYLMR